MAIGPLGKSIKKSSYNEGFDKLILLKEQISADCLTLISPALQNSSKVLYEFYSMLYVLQIGMLRFTERLNATLLFYANSWPEWWLNCVVIYSWQESLACFTGEW